MKKFLTIFISVLSVFAASAQDNDPNDKSQILSIADLSMDDYLAIELPPLQTLLENAKGTSIVRYYKKHTEIEKAELKNINRTWLRFIKLNASYQYGQMTDNVLYQEDLPPVYRYQDKTQSWYNAGASLSLPLEEIFTRGNRAKQQKMAIEESELNTQRWYDDLTLKIVDAYTAVVENLSMLRIKAEAKTIASAQYKVTETDFINGKVDAQTLSRQKNIESSAVREYEQTRAALNNALLKLEIYSNTQIINK